MSFIRLAALTILLGAASWSAASAQERGSIAGTVVDATSGRPLPSAQVFLPGTGLGGLTNSAGRFLVLNVPAGVHAIRTELIGYAATEGQITVVAGQAATLDFELSEQALALDEIVVTGTAGQARRREVGNTISQIRFDEVQETATDIGQLLQGRVIGASITEGSGNSGSGADIRLRGNVSMSMSNQPLVYIDGVRVKSEPYPAGGGADDPPGPLSDLNPNDIDRIEIVKGPAATTMYGTEAAAGVIQIFTKTGGTGAPQWTAEVQQGFSYFRPFGTDEVPFMYLDPVFRNGYQQRYAMTVRGGAGDQLGYFLSGAFGDADGAVETDSEEQLNLRGNTQFRPHPDFLVQFNTSYSQLALTQARQGNTTSGIVMTAIRGPDSYMGSRSPETLRILLEEENATQIDRFIGGLTVNYTPGSDFTHRVTVGYDFAQYEGERSTPYCWRCPLGQTGDKGTISRRSNRSQLWSIDYTGTLGFDVVSGIRSSLSFGFQALDNSQETITASGDDFPGPGDYTVESTARREGGQSKLRVITGGFFVQNIFALSDKYFLTAGVRVDGNSAFGSGLGLQAYPKISASYVVSDEPFWPEGLGQVKLRGAYGLAGRAPGAFDAVRTWDPVGYGTTQAAFEPQNLGNEDLGPERTSELELGFDGSFLEGRVSTEFTYYRRNTNDALFNVASPESEGGWNAQLENVGKILNHGFEVGVSGTVFDTRNFRWELGGGLATNKSKIIDLGGAPSFSVGENGWVIEGQPAPVIRGETVLNPNEMADPVISDETHIFGPSYPTHIITGNTAVTVPGGITISARGEYFGGFYMNNYFESGALNRNIEHPKCFDAYEKAGVKGRPDTGRQDELLAWERAQCFGMDSGDYTITAADYFELRDISMSVPLSNLLPVLNNWATRTDLTVSARNVWFWTKDVVTGHPEQNESGTSDINQGHDLVKGIDEQLPPSSRVTFSLRFVF